MRKILWLILVLTLVPVADAWAQVRPGSFTAVTTTDTSANSLLVGCAVGSTTCSGGIKSGAIVSASGGVTLTTGNLLISTGNLTLSAGNLTMSAGTLTVGNVSASGTVAAAALTGGGSGITGIAETNITDGSLLARVAANETISGAWTINNTLTMSGVLTSTNSISTTAGLGGSTLTLTHGNPLILFNENDQGTNLKMWYFWVSGGTLAVTTLTDAQAGILNAWTLDRSGNGSFAGTLSSSTFTSTANINATSGTITGAVVTANSSMNSAATITAGTTIAAGTTVTAPSGYLERGRSIALGVSICDGFNSGHYTSNNGAWTVDSGDVVANCYSLDGTTMNWTVRIQNSTTPGTFQGWRVTIPAGKTAQLYATVPALAGFTSGDDYVPNAYCYAQAGLTYVECVYYNLATVGLVTNDFNTTFQIQISVN